MLYALAGVGTLVSAALIYSWATEAEENQEDDLQDLLQEKGFDNVKKTDQGLLDPKYFLELLQFVGEQMKKRSAASRKSQYEQRRLLLKDNDMDAYKQLVQQAI